MADTGSTTRVWYGHAADAYQAGVLAEREACARLAEQTANRWLSDRHYGRMTHHFANAARTLADLIRTRGET